MPNRGMEGLTLTPDGHTHEYLFLLDEPATTGVANSEITALSDNTFLIDERDSGFPSATGYKKLGEVNLEGATDVAPEAKVSGAT